MYSSFLAQTTQPTPDDVKNTISLISLGSVVGISAATTASTWVMSKIAHKVTALAAVPTYAYIVAFAIVYTIIAAVTHALPGDVFTNVIAVITSILGAPGLYSILMGDSATPIAGVRSSSARSVKASVING